MVTGKIPVLLFSQDTVRRMGRRLKGPANVLGKLAPKMKDTLSKIGFDVEPGAYLIGSLLSSLLYGLLFFGLILAIVTVRGEMEGDPMTISLAAGAGIWFMFLLLHLVYPSIILTKIATKESKDLLFALREIMIDVNSGIPLFHALQNVSVSGYGYISDDFKEVVGDIERGVPEKEAMKILAVRTKSEFLKRALWQMVNALESGAGMGSALEGIVESTENYVYREIRDYSSNLNFLMLIYMLVAAVVPSIGVTFMVLLSAFSDLGVDVGLVLMLIAASVVMQIAMIGYMGATRPEIFGG